MSIKAKARRRVTILIAAILLGTASIAGVYAYRTHRYRVYLMEVRKEGLAAYAAGDDEVAAIKLNEYIGKYRDDIEALAAFVKVRPKVPLPDNQHISITMYSLRHLLELQPQRIDDHHALLDLYMHYSFFVEAVDSADKLLDKNPQDVQAIRSKGVALLQLQRFGEALKWAKRWTEAAPDDLNAREMVLELMKQLQLPANEIYDYADELAKANPQNAGLQLVRVMALRINGDREAAMKSLRSLSQGPTTDADFILRLVQELDFMGMYGDSLAVLTRMDASGDAKVRQALIRRQWENGQLTQVLKLTEDLDASNAKTPAEIAAMRALAWQGTGAPQEAEKIRTALSRRGNDPLAAAWVVIIDKTAGKKPSDLKELVRIYTRAVQATSAGYLRYYLGDVYAQMGETSLAGNAWIQAAMTNPTWALPLLRLSDLMMAEGNIDKAVHAANEAYYRSQGKLTVAKINLVKIFTVLIEAGRSESAEKVLKTIDEILQSLPGDEQTLTAKVALLASRKDREGATATLRTILTGSKGPSEQTLLRLASLSRLYQLTTEEECLARCERDYGMTVGLAKHRAGQLAAAGKVKEGLAILETGAQKNPKPANLEWQLAIAGYEEANNDAQAKVSWKELADANPEDLRIQLLAIRSAAVIADRQLSQRVIDRIHALTGDQGVRWRIERARWILGTSPSEKDLREALVLLNEVIRVDSEHTEPRLLLAQALEKLDMLESAAKQLMVASSLSPRSVPIILECARVYQKQKNYVGAQEQLNRIPELKPTDAQKRMAAAMLLEQGDSRRALALLEGTTPAAMDQRMEILLAAAYRQQNQLEKAAAIYSKLLGQKPDAGIVMASADLFALQGKIDKAKQTLELLDTMQLPPGVKDQYKAEFAANWEGPEAAIKRYEAAIAAAPKTATFWKALAYYQFMLGRSDDALATVNRGLQNAGEDAALLRMKGNAEILRATAGEAVLRPLQQMLLSDSADSSLAADVLRIVRASQQAKETPQQIYPKLFKLADANPQVLTLQLFTAQVALAAGKPDEAAMLATRVSQAFPTNADAMRLATLALREAGRWSEMLASAKRWKERLVGDALPADIYIAEAHLRLNLPLQTLAQLEPYLPLLKTQPEKYMGVAALYSKGLLLSGSPKAAADLVRPLAIRGEGGRALWLQLATMPSGGEYAANWLTEIESLIPKESDQEKAGLAEALLAVGHGTQNPACLAKGIEILKYQASRNVVNPRSLALLATEYQQTGNTAAAEQMYRQSLAKDPNQPILLNNLSMLLTQHDDGKPEAVAMALQAVKLQPTVANFYDTLGYVQMRNKAYADALATLGKAIELEPETIAWRIRLGEIMVESGKRDQLGNTIARIDELLKKQVLPGSLKARMDALRQAKIQS